MNKLKKKRMCKTQQMLHDLHDWFVKECKKDGVRFEQLTEPMISFYEVTKDDLE